MQILDLSNYTLNPYGIAPSLIGILTLSLGSFVLIRERSTPISLAFYLVSWVATTWLICYIGMYSANSPDTALWWAKAQNMAVPLIPSTVYLFTLAIIRRIRQNLFQLLIYLSLSIFFSHSAGFTDRYVAGIYDYPWGYYTKYGVLIFPFLAFFVGLTIISLRLLWLEYRRARLRTQQRRLKAFLIAFAIAYIASIDYLPAFGIPVFPSGYIAVFAFLVLAARVIWRYRLMDLTPSFAAKQILRTMADALLVLDRDGIIRVVNQATCRLFSRSEKDLVGKPLWTISGNFLPKERLQRALRSGVIQRYETNYSTKDEDVILDVSASAVTDQENDSVGIVCIARTITDKKIENRKHYDNTV